MLRRNIIISLQRNMNQRLNYVPKRTEVLLIRHGQSEFNSATQQFQNEFQQDVHSEEAKRQFQFDPRLIDSPLTSLGIQQALKARNQPNLDGVEIVFVSPLKRALQTAQLIFGNKNVKFIVLPKLTQILSKICDISHSIQEKSNQFPHMDFSLFGEKQANWQLDLLTEDQKTEFNLSQRAKPSVQEITNFLYQCICNNFPNSTQKRSDCTLRSQGNKYIIQNICSALQVSKVAVVAHRRVLIEMTKTSTMPDGIAMKNCEVKTLFLE